MLQSWIERQVGQVGLIIPRPDYELVESGLIILKSNYSLVRSGWWSDWVSQESHSLVFCQVMALQRRFSGSSWLILWTKENYSMWSENLFNPGHTPVPHMLAPGAPAIHDTKLIEKSVGLQVRVTSGRICDASTSIISLI